MKDSRDAEHVVIMERGNMELRQCMSCHRLAAANSGDPIDHKESCQYNE